MTFLDAARVARIVRHRGDLTGQHTTEEIVHVITSLPADLADPATLAAPAPRTLVDQIPAPHPRRHLGRRRHRARTGHPPTFLAVIRNTITAAGRLTGHTNIAAARRPATLGTRTAIAWFSRRTQLDAHPL